MDKSALYVVVRQNAAARDVVCSAHDCLLDLAVRHNVAGGARELHVDLLKLQGGTPLYYLKHAFIF